VFAIAPGAVVTIDGVTITGGSTAGAGFPLSVIGSGISISSGATLVLRRSIVQSNRDPMGVGGGIFNGGDLRIISSTIRGNLADFGGGITNDGRLLVVNSTIVGNSGRSDSGGILNHGTLLLFNSTVSRNSSGHIGGGLSNLAEGTTTVVNSTISENSSTDAPGIWAGDGMVMLLNTIVAGNSEQQSPAPSPDCFGSGLLISFGNNLIGDPTGCPITLQPGDLTGEPGLDTFTDNGRPGNGHFPLLPHSQAIDAGNNAACPRTDQLGQRRIGPCDIGAIEFRDRDDRPHDEGQGEEPHANTGLMHKAGKLH
jgi:hypothetical protein